MTGAGARRALFLSRDPGSVRAMLPVARALAARPEWSVVALGLSPTAAMVRDDLAGTAAAVEEIDTAAWARSPAACLEAALARHRPDVVVSGSSPAKGPPPETPEQHLIAAARRAGVPSVGILDFWGNYPARFGSNTGMPDPRLLPDRLCVLDRLCHRDLAAMGVEPERMAVTHNPAFDAVHRTRAEGARPRSAARSARRRLLFASQPLAEHRSLRGWDWTQYQLFEATRHALPEAAGWDILVWLHPLEVREPWQDLVADLRGSGRPEAPVAIDSDQTLDTLLDVDVLVTSHSSITVQAAMLDVPIVSFRPFASVVEPLVIERLAIGTTIRSPSALARYFATVEPDALRRTMAQRRRALTAEGAFYSDGCATARVVEEVAGVVDAMRREMP